MPLTSADNLVKVSHHDIPHEKLNPSGDIHYISGIMMSLKNLPHTFLPTYKKLPHQALLPSLKNPPINNVWLLCTFLTQHSEHCN